MNITFITGNENKLKEANAILGKLGICLESKEIDLVEVQDVNAKKVAEDKARQAYEIFKKPVLVEDVGFYINCLNGFPGALIKWLLKKVELKDIVKMIEFFEDKDVIAQVIYCYFDGEELKSFVGEVEGTIVEPQGENGFGFDAIIIPNEMKKTIAEMSFEEKNEVSMRRVALEKFGEWMKGRG